MKNLLSSKKLTRQNLKEIKGSASVGEICCVKSCETGDCVYWTQPKVQCPLFPDCL